MKVRFPVWGLLLCLALSWAGCSKSATSVAEQHDKEFASADPQVKADWGLAVAATKTNGFVTAIITLKKLQQANLKPEQLQAVNQTLTAVSDKMYEASNKGDANAEQAIQTLRSAMTR